VVAHPTDHKHLTGRDGAVRPLREQGVFEVMCPHGLVGFSRGSARVRLASEFWVRQLEKIAF
jgi:hypothetical protein